MTRRTWVLTAAFAALIGAAASIHALSRDTSPRPKKLEPVKLRQAAATDVMSLLHPVLQRFGVTARLDGARKTVVLRGSGDLKEAARLVRELDVPKADFHRVFETFHTTRGKTLKQFTTAAKVLVALDELRKLMKKGHHHQERIDRIN